MGPVYDVAYIHSLGTRCLERFGPRYLFGFLARTMCKEVSWAPVKRRICVTWEPWWYMYIIYQYTSLCMLHVCQSIILYINPKNYVIMIYFQFVGELQQI